MELVEEHHDPWISESLIAQPHFDTGPVLLLYTGIIGFVAGPASGELDGVFYVGKMGHQAVVEKLRAVIAIETPQRKRKGLGNMMDLLKHPCLSFAPDGSLFCPSRGNVNAINSIGEHASSGGAAVGHGIGLKESGPGLIPLIGVDGCVFSQPS
jgi:hypothetical protein